MRIERIDLYVVKLDHHYRLRGTDETPGRLPGSDYFVEPHWRQAYSRRLEACLVKVTTDTGLAGWGEAQAPLVPEAACVVAERLYGPYLLGRDPMPRARLFDELYHLNNVRGHGSGFAVDAIAALDIALWDIAGQHLGAPVCELLGGPFRETLPAYVSGLRQPTLAEQCEAAHGFVADGFRAFKLFLGHSVAADVAALRAVRAAVGPDIDLMCDLLWRYDVDDALRVGRVLEAEDYRWLEAPIAAENVAGHARLAGALSVPIAVGEALRTTFEFRPWLEGGAVAVVQPDVMRTGITGATRIAALAESRHLPVAPHVGVSTGVGMATTWQFAAATASLFVQEYQHDLMPSAQSLLATRLEVEGGSLVVPLAPGIGVDVDENAVQAAATEHRTLEA